ncbi:MFS transporter [Pseudonocardia sp. WMMC193]|uniref:MFS transporter n=1 Tax=Pseudonocardia sp. WMMC193 TaxID=2911965 RepID=UPI001F01B6D1|nr:MFS transporter [Pseudonocardia sp. WMMC193]MCF7548771.1 MFS transporter [Pseudonocardia sp. WMMC193]
MLGLAVWFSASAVAPALQREWAVGAVLLTVAVQLGFVAGAVGSAVLTLADRLPPHRLVACSALGAAACTALLTLVDSAGPALVLRGLTGLFLAGVYPVGMKLTTSWSGPYTRGRDLGLLLAALTLGSALPHLLRGLALPWRGVLLGAAAAGVLAAVIAAVAVRPGPGHAPSPPPNPRYALALLRDRTARLVVFGYLGHMWELYAFWTWLPTYLAAATTVPAESAHLVAFAAAGVAGAAGCVVAGRAADRVGPVPVALGALAVSGTCCLLAPVVADGTPAAVVGFVLVWGAAVIADSALFTAALSDVVDRRYVGTALTAQTALGFLLTSAAIPTVAAAAALTDWRLAAVALLPGPLLGVRALRALLARRVTLEA